MGRSVTLLTCWYLYTGSMNVSQALAFVKRRRPQTSLTRRQVRRIQEIALLLMQTAGKLPVQALYERAEEREPNAYQYQ
jgi:protein-tyrosine phosphatase